MKKNKFIKILINSLIIFAPNKLIQILIQLIHLSIILIIIKIKITIIILVRENKILHHTKL